jgi:hypothetical protein
MEEIWKTIENYEGLYQVSNLGRVKSLPRNTTRGKILANRIDKKGYHYVSLSKNGKEKPYSIHRLVALSFIENPEGKITVNHKNGIKADNNLLNLEWATRSENQIHAYATGLCKKGEMHGSSKLTEVQAIEIKYGYKNIPYKQIVQIYGITKSQISDIRRGKKWKHI